MATATTAPAEIPETIKPLPMTSEKLSPYQRMLRRVMGVGQLLDMAVVADVAEKNEVTNRLMRKRQDGTLGQPEAGGSAEDDMRSMKLHSGDVQEIHYHIESGGNVSESQPSKLLTAGKLLATLAIGGGLGAGAISSLDWLLAQVQPPAAEFEDTDTDTSHFIKPRE